MKTRIINLTFLLKLDKISYALKNKFMKEIDFTPVVQCVATIIMCWFALYCQSVYPHSNAVPLISLCVGVVMASSLSSIDSRPGNEHTSLIVFGLFILAWIIVPLVALNYFEGDKAVERRMWWDIYAILFTPFIGLSYGRKYA